MRYIKALACVLLASVLAATSVRDNVILAVVEFKNRILKLPSLGFEGSDLVIVLKAFS